MAPLASSIDLPEAVRATTARFHQDRPPTVQVAIAALGPLAGRRAPAVVRRTTVEDVALVGLPAALDGVAALSIDAAVAEADVAAWAAAIDARPELGHRFDVGRLIGAAWFAAVTTIPDPQVRSDAYRHAIGVGARDVAAVAPELATRCTRLSNRLLGARVRRRRGWAGPGFVEFGGPAALGRDSDAHIDWEGLVEGDPVGLFDESYTFVLMVRPSERGGDLRVWGIGADPGSVPEPDPSPAAHIHYQPGTLAVFPSRELHQVTEIHGARPRITVVWQVRRVADGWELWH